MILVAELQLVINMKIWVEVPDSWKEKIETATRLEGWEKRTDYVRELIKKDLVSKGLLGVKAVVDSSSSLHSSVKEVREEGGETR